MPLFRTIRLAKYAVFLGWGYGSYRIGLWYIDELKSANIYDYKIKRVRLLRDIALARKVHKYGEERTRLAMEKAQEALDEKEANEAFEQNKKN